MCQFRPEFRDYRAKEIWPSTTLRRNLDHLAVSIRGVFKGRDGRPPRNEKRRTRWQTQTHAKQQSGPLSRRCARAIPSRAGFPGEHHPAHPGARRARRRKKLVSAGRSRDLSFGRPMSNFRPCCTEKAPSRWVGSGMDVVVVPNGDDSPDRCQ
jgi:hypothetical protein